MQITVKVKMHRDEIQPPVLLVHGIWDTGARFERMKRALVGAGIREVRTVDLVPNDGSAPIPKLASQVEEAAGSLMAESSTGQLDVVGFSMGALVSRYWLQRLSGKQVCRRFVSISGPHQGTVQARWMPRAEGVRQMLPQSELIQGLAGDPDPFGSVEVHSVWTPYDLMILPPRSSRLEGTHEHPLPILLHRWMISHRRAIETVREILQRPVRSEAVPTPEPT